MILEINYDIDSCIKNIFKSMVEQGLMYNLHFVKLKWKSKLLYCEKYTSPN